jgi:WD40 repeat protein
MSVTLPAENRPFFIAGGPLPPDSASYVERAADQELLQTLLAREYARLLESPQMGVSSLLIHVSQQLKEMGVRAVRVDLARISVQNITAEQWYAGFISETARTLYPRDELLGFWDTHSDMPPVWRCLGALTEAALPARETPLVVLLDHCEAAMGLPFGIQEFFAAVRECHDMRAENPALGKLTFCLATRKPLEEHFLQDSRTDPFAVAKRVTLTDFTLKDAEGLAAGLSGLAGRRLGAKGRADGFKAEAGARKLIARVFHWTGGQPYLTQRVCRAITGDDQPDEERELPNEDEERSPDPEEPQYEIKNPKVVVRNLASVDTLCREVFLTRGRDQHLVIVEQRLKGGGAPLVELYGRVLAGKKIKDNPNDDFITTLKLTGAVHPIRGRLRVKNRVYETLFDRDWAEAAGKDLEAERVRLAYRRGARRSAYRAGFVALLFAAAGGIAAYFGFKEWRQGQKLQSSFVKESSLRQNAEARAYSIEIGLAADAAAAGNIARAKSLLEAQRPTDGRADQRDFAWRYLWARCNTESLFRNQDQNGPVRALAFSSDGSLIASAGADRTILLLSATTGAVTGKLTGHIGAVADLAFSPDGKRVYSAGEEGVMLWNVGGGAPAARISSPALRMALSRDGRRIATGDGQGRVSVYDTSSLARLLLFSEVSGQPVTSLAISPDGSRLASGHAGGQSSLWSLTRLRLERSLPPHGAAVTGADWSSDSRLLATSFRDGTALLLEAATGREVWRVQDGSPLNGVAFSPDGTHIATAGEAGARVWTIAKRAEAWRASVGGLRVVAFNRKGGYLATGSSSGETRLWDWDRETEKRVLRKGVGGPVAILFGPKGEHIAMSAADGEVSVTEASTGRTLSRFSGSDRSKEIAFMPDGKLALAPGDMHEVWMWDWRTSDVINGAGPEAVIRVAASPDGTWLATSGDGEDGAVDLWDARTLKPSGQIPGGGGRIAALALSSAGRWLAVAHEKSGIVVWDCARRAEVARLEAKVKPGVTVRFAPDSSLLGCISVDGAVNLWECARWKARNALNGHSGGTSCFDFSSDGRTLATGGADGAVILWNTRAGRKLLSIPGRSGALDSIALSPDGGQLAASAGGTVWIWTGAPLD